MRPAHLRSRAVRCAATVALAVLVIACGGAAATPTPATTGAAATPAGSPGAGARTVEVTVTSAGCPPVPATVSAGTVTFRVANDGANAVSEVEVKQGERILAEKENLAPGLSGTFTVDLAAGQYIVECPGATDDESELEVTP